MIENSLVWCFSIIVHPKNKIAHVLGMVEMESDVTFSNYMIV